MDARQYNLAHALFLEACDRPDHERAQFIDQACGGDAQVKAAVLRMIELDQQELAVGDLAARRSQLMHILADQPSLVEQEAAAEPIPSQIGPYRVIRKVGQGGMGAVFLAEQDQPRRQVAVKMLRQGAGSVTLLKRFRREIELLGRLQHPGIAQIYSAGSFATPTGSTPYFAMEFVDGAPLTRFADQHKLSLEQRVKLVANACDAVHFAHQQGIVHRDLKPQNMLVRRAIATDAHDSASGDCTLKILDFGIARVIDDVEHSGSIQTEVGLVIGTICYMSPEQLSGNNAAIDIRTDVYALGVVLYELLTGRLPHDLSDKTLPQAARMVSADPPTRLSRVRPELRGDLEAIVTKALEKDKTLRYPSASEFGVDLRRYLQREPVAARPLTALYQLSRFAQRNRTLVGVATVGAACLLLGVVGTSVGLYRAIQSETRARESEAIARTESYRLSLAAADASWRTDPVQALATLDAGPPELRGWEWAHFRSRMDVSLVSWPSDSPPAIAIDPAGTPIAAMVRDGAIEIIEVESGRVRAVCRSSSPLRSPILNREGSRLVALRGEDAACEIAGFEAATGRQLFAAPAVAGAATISDDGRLAAFTSTDRTIEVREVQSGTVLTRSPIPADFKVFGLRFTPGGFLAATGANASRIASTIIYSTMTGELITPPDVVDNVEVLLDARAGWVVGHPPGSLRVDLRAVEVWPQDDPSKLRLFKGHAGNLQHAVISADGLQIASSSGDSTVRLWDIATGMCRQIFGVPHALHTLRWSQDGQSLIGIDSSNAVRVLSVQRAESLVLAGHQSFVYHAAFSPDGSLIASSGWNNEVRLWDARTGASLCVVVKPDGEPKAAPMLGFSVDGSLLIVGGLSKHPVDGWRWSIAGLRATPGDPDAARVLTPGPTLEDGGLASLAASTRFRTHSGAQLFAMSSDRSMCGLVDSNGLLLLSDQSGAVKQTLMLGKGSSRVVAISPQGCFVATSNDDRIIRIWDASSGTQVHSLPPAAQAIFTMDFSPDGTRLVSAGLEGTISIWDTKSWQRLAELRGHAQYVSAVSFDADGTRLLSASGDGTVRIWDSLPTSQRVRQPARQPDSDDSKREPNAASIRP